MKVKLGECERCKKKRKILYNYCNKWYCSECINYEEKLTDIRLENN